MDLSPMTDHGMQCLHCGHLEIGVAGGKCVVCDGSTFAVMTSSCGKSAMCDSDFHDFGRHIHIYDTTDDDAMMVFKGLLP